MRKIPYSLAVIGAMVIILGTACSTAAPAPTAAPSVPQAVIPATVQPAPTVAPSVPQTGGASAPICQTTTSCQALKADQAQIGCVKKVPYTNVSVPPGTTFE